MNPRGESGDGGGVKLVQRLVSGETLNDAEVVRETAAVANLTFCFDWGAGDGVQTLVMVEAVELVVVELKPLITPVNATTPSVEETLPVG